MPTFDSNTLPSTTGVDLGSTTQRWDVFAQTLDVSGNATISGTLTTGGTVVGTAAGTYVVDGTSYTTIQAAIDAANAVSPKGFVIIPSNYAGTDTFTNPGKVGIFDQRRRTLSSPQGSVFDATTFGAKADGVTNNKQALIDAVAAANTAGGGIVEFPATDLAFATFGYAFTGPVDLSTANTSGRWITIRFHGGAIFNGPSASIVAATGASRSANVVTITTTAAHGLTNGNKVHVADVVTRSFNGVFTIASVPTSTTFTYAQTGADATSGGGVASTPGLILDKYMAVVGTNSSPSVAQNFGKKPATSFGGTAGPIIYANGKNPMYFSDLGISINSGTTNRRGMYFEGCTNVTLDNVHISAVDPATSNHIPLEIEGGSTSFGWYIIGGGFSGVSTNVTDRPSIWLHNGKGNWHPKLVYIYRTFLEQHGILLEGETGNTTGTGSLVIRDSLYETFRDALVTHKNSVTNNNGSIVITGNEMADGAFGSQCYFENQGTGSTYDVIVEKNVGQTAGVAAFCGTNPVYGVNLAANGTDTDPAVTSYWNVWAGTRSGKDLDSSGVLSPTNKLAMPTHVIPGTTHVGLYADMATPAAPTLVVQAGGSLAIGTFTYKISARDAFGEETVGSVCSSSATTTSGNQTIQVSWTTVTGATDYRVYRYPTSNCTGTGTQFTVAASPYTDDGTGGVSPRDPGAVTLAGAAKIAPATGGNVASFGLTRFATSGAQTFPGLLNTTPLTISTFSLTGANAQPMVDFSGTWNTTGTPTLVKANVTDTASGAASLLVDLQVGGASKFKVDKAGSFFSKKISSNGTALVPADFSLSAGWGTTATVTAVTGTDQAWQITVTSSGTGQAPSPTITVTFSSTWTLAPITITKMVGGTGIISDVTEVPTATTNVITFVDTPVAGLTYIFASIGMGR